MIIEIGVELANVIVAGIIIISVSSILVSIVMSLSMRRK